MSGGRVTESVFVLLIPIVYSMIKQYLARGGRVALANAYLTFEGAPSKLRLGGGVRRRRETPRAKSQILTLRLENPTLYFMEVRLNPDLQAKLAQLASQQGRDTEALVVEAVERMVNYDEWFIREVEKGIAAADRGEFIEHGEVGKRMNQRYPG
jgi:predicted transcriptional regulator